MPEHTRQSAGRYIIVLDPAADIEKIAADLQSAGCQIVSRLDFIRTLVVEGGDDTMAVAGRLDGVKSVELEGTVRTQD